MTVIDEIRDRRRLLGMTRADAARIAGVRQWGWIEAGRTDPTAAVFARMAETVGMRLAVVRRAEPEEAVLKPFSLAYRAHPAACIRTFIAGSTSASLRRFHRAIRFIMLAGNTFCVRSSHLRLLSASEHAKLHARLRGERRIAWGASARGVGLRI